VPGGRRWLLTASGAAAAAALAAPGTAGAAVCTGTLNSAGCPNYQRIPVFPSTDAPLTRGFIEDRIIREFKRYAKEVYHLVGARPNTTYQVRLQIHINNGICAGPAFTQPATTIKTSKHGNGRGFVIAPGPSPDNPGGPPPAPAIQNLTNSIVWEFVAGDTVDYHTNCIPVFENPPKSGAGSGR
jgi:hypothetical protein